MVLEWMCPKLTEVIDINSFINVPDLKHFISSRARLVKWPCADLHSEEERELRTKRHIERSHGFGSFRSAKTLLISFLFFSDWRHIFGAEPLRLKKPWANLFVQGRGPFSHSDSDCSVSSGHVEQIYSSKAGARQNCVSWWSLSVDGPGVSIGVNMSCWWSWSECVRDSLRSLT